MRTKNLFLHLTISWVETWEAKTSRLMLWYALPRYFLTVELTRNSRSPILYHPCQRYAVRTASKYPAFPRSVMLWVWPIIILTTYHNKKRSPQRLPQLAQSQHSDPVIRKRMSCATDILRSWHRQSTELQKTFSRFLSRWRNQNWKMKTTIQSNLDSPAIEGIILTLKTSLGGMNWLKAQRSLGALLLMVWSTMQVVLNIICLPVTNSYSPGWRYHYGWTWCQIRGCKSQPKSIGDCK